MQRYIDADALKQGVGSYSPVKYTYEYGLVITVEDIDSAPTADVVEKERYDRLLENATIISEALNKYQNADMVEVIRCKDCVHGIPTRIDIVTMKFSDERYCNRHHMCHIEDYYCADGKRKETEDEEK